MAGSRLRPGARHIHFTGQPPFRRWAQPPTMCGLKPTWH